MSIWFIRCNGETAHNRPGTSRYIPGERPNWPDREFNYHDECLEQGFARYGFPAAGDLREPGWRSRARSAYGSMLEPRHERYLQQFAGQSTPATRCCCPRTPGGTRCTSTSWSRRGSQPGRGGGGPRTTTTTTFRTGTGSIAPTASTWIGRHARTGGRWSTTSPRSAARGSAPSGRSSPPATRSSGWREQRT